ncbi:MAG: flavodoxin domain-containing protein, partial [Bacilli bacterium]|nr:flavodoxin domain-containing protein [Bacilli bacterium]
MKRVNILSWPKGGETEITANKILDTFNNMQSDIKAYELDFLNLSEDKLRSCDLLIVGGSTIKDDNWLIANNTTKWGQFFNFLRLTDLSGLKAAVFSIGDQELFPDNFVDGMSVIRNALAIKGARVIGYWPTESYDFNDSRSI